MNCPLRQIWFESFSQKLFLLLYFALHTTNERTNKQTNERTNRRTNKQTNERTNRQMNERTDEWTKDIFTHERQCSKNVSLFVKLWPWWKFALHNFFFAMWKLNEASKTFLLGKNSNYSRVQKTVLSQVFFFRFLTQKSENMTVALLRRKNYSLLKWCWLRGKMHYSLIKEKTPKKFFVESGSFDRIQLDHKDYLDNWSKRYLKRTLDQKH